MNLEQLRAYKPQILTVAHEHGVGNIRVFGSVARGDADENSDVDFLVTLGEDVGLEFAGFKVELEDILGISVDLVSDKGISPFLKERILSEAVPL